MDEHRTVAGCGLQFSARAVFGSVCFRATPVPQSQQEYDGLFDTGDSGSENSFRL